MAAAGAAIFCELQSSKKSVIPSNSNNKFDKPTTTPSLPVSVKTVLQPRLCTLRSYASDSSEILIKSLPIRTRTRPRPRPRTVVDGRNDDEVVDQVVEGVTYGDDMVMSSFFASLSEYIENSKKSQYMEIISGRLAMVVFAATVTMEFVTGNSLFQKMDLQGIAEATGVCLAAIVSAAVFAWFSSNRTKVGRVFAISCNSFIDSLIDNLIDGGISFLRIASESSQRIQQAEFELHDKRNEKISADGDVHE